MLRIVTLFHLGCCNAKNYDYIKSVQHIQLPKNRRYKFDAAPLLNTALNADTLPLMPIHSLVVASFELLTQYKFHLFNPPRITVGKNIVFYIPISQLALRSN